MRRFLFLISFACFPLAVLYAQRPALIDTFSSYSPVLKRDFTCIVYTPAGGIEKKFPVVYLLHGYSGSYLDWPRNVTNLSDYSTKHQFIIVCPDGGYRSWYINSPVDSTSKMESFFINDLPGIIDDNYPTIRSKHMRAITGLSMGGHGALMLSMKYPDVFGSCSSISGTVDLVQIAGKYESHKTLGDYSADNQTWINNSVLKLADEIRDSSIHIFLDCGTEDYFMKGNRLLHEKLLKRKITHDYTERTGNHTWNYWTSALPYHFLYFEKKFNLNKKNL